MTAKENFRSAIKRGTGEAHLILQANPTIDFSKEILKAAVKNFAYDPQIEPSKAEYIAELIQLSDKKDKLIESVLKALLNKEIQGYELDELFNIVAIFAKTGNINAKKAIYQRFHSVTNEDDQDDEDLQYLRGESEIIELDGLEGLKYVVETKGKIIAKNSKLSEDSYLVDSFQKDNPSIKVYEELEKAAENNLYIKTYLATIKKHKWEIYKGKKQKYNYQSVKEKINKLQNVRLRNGDLTDKEIQKLANDFLQETGRLKQEKYLRIFSTIKFPVDYQPILKIAKGKNSKTDRLVEYAVKALQYFSGDDIREFAIKKLSKTGKPNDYLYLLVSNYKEGDAKLLASIAERYKSFEMIHSLVWGYIAVYEANPTKECQEPLEAIYDRLNCGLHRKAIVKIMIENGVLPDKIREEIRFDSYDEIRKLYTENFGDVEY